MRPSLAERLGGALALTLVAGTSAACTLLPGAPWGELEEATLEVTFAPALDEHGRVTTARGYTLAIDDLRLSIDTLSLFVAALEGAPFGHDHAHEHGGHAHGASALTEAREGEPEEALVLEGDEVALDVTGASTRLALEGCEGACGLPRGELVRLEVALSSLALAGTAFDTERGPAARLPDEGTPLFARVDGLAHLHAPLTLLLDGSEPTHVSVTAQLTLPPGIFDDVDFAALPRDDQRRLRFDEGAAAAVRAALSESELAVDHDHVHEHEHDHHDHEHDHHDHDHDHE